MSSKPGHKDPTLSAGERMAGLEQEIQQLTARLPKHSTPPSMLLQLEELEEELEALRAARHGPALPGIGSAQAPDPGVDSA